MPDHIYVVRKKAIYITEAIFVFKFNFLATKSNRMNWRFIIIRFEIINATLSGSIRNLEAIKMQYDGNKYIKL